MVTSRLADGKGSVGKLLTDETMYDQLNATTKIKKYNTKSKKIELHSTKQSKKNISNNIKLFSMTLHYDILLFSKALTFVVEALFTSTY